MAYDINAVTDDCYYSGGTRYYRKSRCYLQRQYSLSFRLKAQGKRYKSLALLIIHHNYQGKSALHP